MTCEYTKKQLAELQIHRAIDLYNSQDYVPSITLAGAADSMIGEALKRQGEQTALDEFVWLVQKLQDISGESEVKAKHWIDYLNHTRNELKHWNDYATTTVTCDWKDRTEEMLDRAVKNYMSFFRDASDVMTQFIHDSVDKRR